MIGYWGFMMRNYQRYKFANSKAKKCLCLFVWAYQWQISLKDRNLPWKGWVKLKKNYVAIIFSNCAARSIQSFFLANA